MRRPSALRSGADRRAFIQDAAAFGAVVLFGLAIVLWTSAGEFHLATGGW